MGIPLLSKLRTRLPETIEGKLQNIPTALVSSLLERNFILDVTSKLKVRNDTAWIENPRGKYFEVTAGHLAVSVLHIFMCNTFLDRIDKHDKDTLKFNLRLLYIYHSYHQQ